MQTISEQAINARREYQRNYVKNYYAKNPEKRKEANERYWENKAKKNTKQNKTESHEIMKKEINISLIDTEKLIIDHRYQRPIVEIRLKEMISFFDINAFGTLIVSDRKDGTFAVIDGQHRLTAARKKNIEMIPCEILYNLSVHQEAEMFLKINVNRGPIKSSNKFKAELMTKNHEALQLKKIVEKVGLSIYLDEGKKGKTNQIRCVNLLKSIQKESPDLLEFTLKIVKNIWDGEIDSLNQTIIGGFWKFLSFYKEKIDVNDLTKKMQTVSSNKIFREMKSASETIEGNRYLISAMIILKYYNKNRKKKLENIMFSNEIIES